MIGSTYHFRIIEVKDTKNIKKRSKKEHLNIRAKASLTFDEGLNGCNKSIEYESEGVCNNCAEGINTSCKLCSGNLKFPMRKSIVITVPANTAKGHVLVCVGDGVVDGRIEY